MPQIFRIKILSTDLDEFFNAIYKDVHWNDYVEKSYPDIVLMCFICDVDTFKWSLKFWGNTCLAQRHILFIIHVKTLVMLLIWLDNNKQSTIESY